MQATTEQDAEQTAEAGQGGSFDQKRAMMSRGEVSENRSQYREQ
jgi:hypothetical protein